MTNLLVLLMYYICIYIRVYMYVYIYIYTDSLFAAQMICFYRSDDVCEKKCTISKGGRGGRCFERKASSPFPGHCKKLRILLFPGFLYVYVVFFPLKSTRRPFCAAALPNDKGTQKHVLRHTSPTTRHVNMPVFVFNRLGAVRLKD